MLGKGTTMLSSGPRRFHPRVEGLEDRSLLTPTSTVLTVAPMPATPGQSVTLTATITGGDFAAGGDPLVFDLVTFLDGGTTLGSVKPKPTGGPNQESRAQFTTSSLALGGHNLSAMYSGGIDFGQIKTNDPSASGTVVEMVNVPPPLPVVMPLDVSELVSITTQRHHSNAPRQQVTLRNIGGTAIAGPVFLLLSGLNRKVRLKNAAGIAQGQGHAGEPYVEDNVSLNPGGEITLMLVFGNPRHKAIHFHTAVLAGPGVV
jgi:hypothetical protein